MLVTGSKTYHFIINGPDCSAGKRQVKFGKTTRQAWPCSFHVSLSPSFMLTTMSVARELPSPMAGRRTKRSGRGGKMLNFVPDQKAKWPKSSPAWLLLKSHRATIADLIRSGPSQICINSLAIRCGWQYPSFFSAFINDIPYLKYMATLFHRHPAPQPLN